jgi:HD superfamily phosphohydrolase YqeK
VIGYGLGKLRSTQLDELEQAKKYAMDQSIKFVMEKQRQVHQQQVILIVSIF